MFTLHLVSFLAITFITGKVFVYKSYKDGDRDIMEKTDIYFKNENDNIGTRNFTNNNDFSPPYYFLNKNVRILIFLGTYYL